MKRRSAYYSRNNSYSRSYNAEVAESEGRYPRTQAAKKMGLSIKAFDAGCKKTGYKSTEWHHVGKYANRVDYYNTNQLAASIEFWEGATTKQNRNYCLEKINNLSLSVESSAAISLAA